MSIQQDGHDFWIDGTICKRCGIGYEAFLRDQKPCSADDSTDPKPAPPEPEAPKDTSAA